MTGGLTGRLARRLARRVPEEVKGRLAGPYTRVRAARADRRFRRRQQDRPSLAPAGDAPRHVVCVVVDALRADAVDPRTTPFLAARREGTAVTTSPWTFPAVSSLVTGRYPHEHGAMRGSDGADQSGAGRGLPDPVPGDRLTLPEAFAAAGYETYGGFASRTPFLALAGRFGTHALYDGASAVRVLDGFLDWFEPRRQGRTFSYLHLGDLEEPVDPPRAYWDAHGVDRSVDGLGRWRYEADLDPGQEGRRYREHRRRLYHAAADYVDDRLSDLRDVLGSEVTLLVTADHGEGFWEHSAFDAARFADSRPAYAVGHGGTPYEPVARVPLAVDGPDLGLRGRRVSLVDLAPTLLDALGHPDLLATSGSSLLASVPADRTLLVEAARYGHEKKAVYRGEWKLIVSPGDGEVVGFSVPGEEPADPPDAIEETLLAALPPWPDGTRIRAPASGLARHRAGELGYV